MCRLISNSNGASKYRRADSSRSSRSRRESEFSSIEIVSKTSAAVLVEDSLCCVSSGERRRGPSGVECRECRARGDRQQCSRTDSRSVECPRDRRIAERARERAASCSCYRRERREFAPTIDRHRRNQSLGKNSAASRIRRVQTDRF